MKGMVTAKMAALKAQRQKALIVYLMAGYPTQDIFESLLLQLSKAGADLVEIGVPFSDPVADGKVIQQAGNVALNQGVTLTTVLDCLQRLKGKIAIPVIIMSYANPILSYGVSKFCEEAQLAGVSGIIIPDGELTRERDIFSSGNLERIRLVAPNTPVERIKTVAATSDGFVYAVTVTGTTGCQLDMNHAWKEYALKIRQATELPVCAGFGISNPDDARAAVKFFDGVICGSAVLKALNSDGLEKALAMIQDLKAAITQ